MEGLLDALDGSHSISIIRNEHYDLLNESREQYLKGSVEGESWEEVKQNLKSK